MPEHVREGLNSALMHRRKAKCVCVCVGVSVWCTKVRGGGDREIERTKDITQEQQQTCVCNHEK